jgi:hypothetical protein
LRVSPIEDVAVLVNPRRRGRDQHGEQYDDDRSLPARTP